MKNKILKYKILNRACEAPIIKVNSKGGVISSVIIEGGYEFFSNGRGLYFTASKSCVGKILK